MAIKNEYISNKIVAKVRDFLFENENIIFQFLEKLVRIESPSSDKEAQHQMFNILEACFIDIDYHTYVNKGKNSGGYLTAIPRNRTKHEPIQLLIGHADTVWPIGSLQQMPIIWENGKLKGPGIYDMKAGLTQIIWALKAIHHFQLPLPFAPVALINSDEEIGSRESTAIISRLSKNAARAYILEPPLGLEGKLKTGRKGIGRFTISIEGKAAHAGLDPGKGASAILELSHQVQQLFELNDLETGITVNVGMVDGGISPNVVAPSAKAVADVRVLTREDALMITNKILNLKASNPDITVKVEGSIGRPPMERNERNQRLWAIAKRLGKSIDLELQEAVAGGGSDGNTTSQYTATLDGLGVPGDGAHALHEHIFTRKLVERTLLLILLLTTKA